MPETDPFDEIQTEIQHARETDQTEVQQHLDQITLSFDEIGAGDRRIQPNRARSLLEKLRGLEAKLEDYEEVVHLRNARQRLEEVIDDPQYVETERDPGEES